MRKQVLPDQEYLRTLSTRGSAEKGRSANTAQRAAHMSDTGLDEGEE